MLNCIVLNRTDYLHKNGFGVNNLQRLICHKTQQTKPNQTIDFIGQKVISNRCPLNFLAWVSKFVVYNQTCFSGRSTVFDNI